MGQTFRIGIMGAGHIADKMADTISQMDGYEVLAIASRTQQKADDFSQRHGIARAYPSYEELVADNDIDLVYIATPHSEHLKNARLALMGSKPCLVEKAFTANQEQARELLGISREKGVLCAEAIWTRYQPMREMISKAVKSGVIGNVTYLSCNLGYPNISRQRIYDPMLAGGALLDVGVYALNFAAMVLGTDIARSSSHCIKWSTGVDVSESITLEYLSGVMASLQVTMSARTDRQGIIAGDKGHIIVENINNPQSIHIFDQSYREIDTIYAPKQITGYEYEVMACKDAISKGLCECPEMPHEEILRIMGQMDGFRQEWNIRYPFE